MERNATPLTAVSRPSDPLFDLTGFLLSDRMWLVLAALGVFYAALWVLSRRRRALAMTPDCTWLQEKRRRSGMTRWVCKTCSVDAYSRDGQPPTECKRNLAHRGNLVRGTRAKTTWSIF